MSKNLPLSPKAQSCLQESITLGNTLRRFWNDHQPGIIDSLRGRDAFAADAGERERTLSTLTALEFQACLTDAPRMNLHAPATPPATPEKATPKR